MPAAAGAVPGAAAATARTLAGLDVAGSSTQGGAAISWSAGRRAGYRFAAVKATEGDYYVNSWAARDLAGAKAAGLVRHPVPLRGAQRQRGPAQAQYAVEYSG